jgi:hypothetical protein
MRGRFVQAYARHFEGRPDVAEAEVRGLLEVLCWLYDTHRTTTPIAIETGETLS